MVLFHSHLAIEFPDRIQVFRDRHPALRCVVAADATEFERALCDVEILCAGPQPVQVLERAPGLRAHIVPFAGVDRAPLQWYQQRGVMLAGSHGNAASVAERGLALLLAAAGRVVEFDAALRRGHWHRRADPHHPFAYWRSLAGARVVFYGTGAIARRMAELLRPLVAHIGGVRGDNARGAPDWLDTLYTGADGAFAAADVIVVTAPLTPVTRGAITYQRLVASHQAVLVNVSRAELIPQRDLYRALCDGVLGAAGLDVWYRSPQPFHSDALPADEPFWELPNVVLSPHAASHSEAGKRGQLESAIETIEAVLAGADPPGRIDPTRGY